MTALILWSSALKVRSASIKFIFKIIMLSQKGLKWPEISWVQLTFLTMVISLRTSEPYERRIRVLISENSRDHQHFFKSRGAASSNWRGSYSSLRFKVRMISLDKGRVKNKWYNEIMVSCFEAHFFLRLRCCGSMRDESDEDFQVWGKKNSAN